MAGRVAGNGTSSNPEGMLTELLLLYRRPGSTLPPKGSSVVDAVLLNPKGGNDLGSGAGNGIFGARGLWRLVGCRVFGALFCVGARGAGARAGAGAGAGAGRFTFS